MVNPKATKARIQYSSRDELDMAVIAYCRGHSRHDLHYRTRLALNGFYAPFAIAFSEASNEEVRRQALRSIRQLTHQIWEIKAQFLPDASGLEAIANELTIPATLQATTTDPESGDDHSYSAIDQQDNASSSFTRVNLETKKQPPPTPVREVLETRPMDEPLREFLGEDAAIMAGLNPFINDLT